MSTADERRPARLLVLVTVVGVVLVIGVLSAALAVPAAPPTAMPRAADTVPPAGAQTSSSFCTAGTGTAATTTVYLTTTTRRPVRGVMTATSESAAGAAGGTFRQSAVAVAPLTTDAVNPGAGLPAGNNASSYAFVGGGMAVTQAVWGSGGWSFAPCASSVSSQWLFSSGSTADGNNLTLSLFNPTASAAMADVSFLTPAGLLSPQPFQGIVVNAGQLVDENVGSFAQSLPEVTTVVSVISGELVSDEFQQWAPGSPSGFSLMLGSTSASPAWHFAATTAARGSTVAFHVGNPSTSPVAVTFSATLPSATVLPRTIDVAGSSTATFTATATSGWPAGAPYVVTAQAGGPVVVGREVAGPAGTTEPGRGFSAGVSTPGLRWLVLPPGIPGAPAASGGASLRAVGIANPEPVPVHVSVVPLGSTRPSPTLVIAPGQLAYLSGRQIAGNTPFVVSATSPVVVEEDAAPSGAPGVVDWPALPFPA
jgi:hypothetical protein